MKSNYSFFKWVKISGTTYSIGTVLVLRVSDEDFPTFGIIDVVLVKNDNVSFAMNVLRTVGQDSHSHSYDIEMEMLHNNCNNYVVAYETIPNPFSVSLIELNCKKYIVTHHIP